VKNHREFFSTLNRKSFSYRSGYLTVLNFLKDEQLQQEIAEDGFWGNGRRYLGQFIHRYCRLAPLEFVVLLAGVVMMEFQRQSG